MSKRSINLRSKGFTLLELLVVIAIIGLLAGIATISFGSARAKARDAKRVSELKQYQAALLLYSDSNTNGAFPAVLSTGILGGAGGTCLDDGGFKIAAATACAEPIYLTKISLAPTPSDCPTAAAGTNDYTYSLVGTTDFQIISCIGQATGGLAAGKIKATKGGLAAY